jgi:cyanophycinase
VVELGTPLVHAPRFGIPTWLRANLVRTSLVACLLVLAGMAGLIQYWHAEARRLEVSVGAPERGGTLVVSGGGYRLEKVMREFVKLAGGKDSRVVVIPGGEIEAKHERNYLREWGAAGAGRVVILHAKSREEACAEGFTGPMKDATGVWLGGGDQAWHSAHYAETPVEEALREVVARNGVVGGTSAGAAVMTRVMIAGGRGEPREGQGLDLFPGAVIDQHFLRRNRLARLLTVLERNPNLVGFGVDEGTALVVRVRDWHLRVVGDSYVMAVVPATETRKARFEVLKPGDQIPLEGLLDADVQVTAADDLDEVLGGG